MVGVLGINVGPWLYTIIKGLVCTLISRRIKDELYALNNMKCLVEEPFPGQNRQQGSPVVVAVVGVVVVVVVVVVAVAVAVVIIVVVDIIVDVLPAYHTHKHRL